MEQWIIYSVGFVFLFWLTSISIQVIKLIKLWFDDKILNLKESIK